MSEKIFVIDDSNFSRFYLRRIIEKCGYEVIGEAGDGEEALKKLGHIKPDIITVDYNMPKMDGLEFITRLRTINKEIKVIVITSLAHQFMMNKAIIAGANEFLVKPVNPDTLLNVLKKFSKKREE